MGKFLEPLTEGHFREFDEALSHVDNIAKLSREIGRSSSYLSQIRSGHVALTADTYTKVMVKTLFVKVEKKRKAEGAPVKPAEPTKTTLQHLESIAKTLSEAIAEAKQAADEADPILRPGLTVLAEEIHALRTRYLGRHVK